MKVDDGESFASMPEGASHGALPERPREPRAPAFLRSVRRTTCRARAASGRTDGFIPDGACSARRKLAGPRTTPERFLVGLPTGRHDDIPPRCATVVVDRSRWDRRGGRFRTRHLLGSPAKR